MSELRLRTTLAARGPAAAIILTDDQVASMNAGKTFPVTVTIGEHTGACRVTRMGGENMIGFSKAARAEFGVSIDQEVDAVISVATGEPEIELPTQLRAALDADPAKRAAFDALAPSKRKEHARSVADAKQASTGERRVAKILEALGR